MRSWEFYQLANGLKRLNRWIQVVLILSLILGLNHLGMKHFLRYDLTGNNRFTLSPETRAYLQEISDPIHIIVTIPENSPRQEEQILYRYIHRLLQEYAYLSRSGGEFLITTEFVDIYKDLSRADFLAREHGLNQINSLLVLSKERQRLVRADELVTFRDRKPEAYKGEATITSAIMEVTQEKSPKLYFLTGHQETDPGDTSPQYGLSQISRELEMRNFTLDKLDLTAVPQVPEDTAILIIADPKGPLLPSEAEKIRTYLFDRAGRLLLWIRPGVESGMEPLLAEWGLYLPDQLVIEPNPQFREANGTLLIRNFGEHEISQSLIQNQTYVVSGLARPVIPRPPSPADERLHLTALFASSKTSWGESAYRSASEPVLNQELDFSGPVPIAAVAERKASSQLGIKVPGGRLVLFGSADLFSNQRVMALGNITTFFNTVNWMLDRDRMLVIPSRPVDTYKFTISENQFFQISLLFLAVPAGIAFFGLIIYWVRRS